MLSSQPSPTGQIWTWLRPYATAVASRAHPAGPGRTRSAESVETADIRSMVQRVQVGLHVTRAGTGWPGRRSAQDAGQRQGDRGAPVVHGRVGVPAGGPADPPGQGQP